MSNKLKLNIDTTIIAEKLMASGDLHSRSCCCGEGHDGVGADNLVDMMGLIELMIDTIEDFGVAGLRELAALAKARVDGLSKMC